MFDKNKKDKKEKAETVNLREFSAKLIDDPQTGNSSEKPENDDYIEMERVKEKGQRSKPNTRDNSRDRTGSQGEPVQDLIDSLKGDLAFTSTMDNGLGRILLSNTAQLKELSKKANVPYMNDLDGFIDDFNEYKDHMNQQIHDRIQTRIEEQTLNIDDILNQKLLDRELSYHDQTETIHPPTVFSPRDVLNNAESKITAANNSFPTKKKFSGSNHISQPSIVEFLINMNAAQRKCNLSEKEFTEYLNLCCTGPVFETVSCMIDAGKTLNEIYQGLLMAFDTRMKPKDAKKSLEQYRPPYGATLNSVSTDIMKLGQRACLGYKKNAQGAAYDNLCIDALLDKLPEPVQILAESTFQELNSRLKRAPTFSDLLRALTKYGSSIDKEFQRLRRSKPERSGFNPNPYFKPRAIKSAQIYQINRAPGGKMDRKEEIFKDTRIQPRNHPNRMPRNSNQKVYVATQENQRNGGNRYNNGNNYNNEGSRNNLYGGNKYNSNNRNSYNGGDKNYRNRDNQSRYNNNSPRQLNKTGLPGKVYCQLCGRNDSHKAKDVCYAIRDDNGKVVPMNPSQGTCGICKRDFNKTLYHPEEFCPNRPIMKRLRTQGLLEWPDRETRNYLDTLNVGQFNNPQ